MTQPSAPAFTLLELLIAIALLGLLSASVFAFMWHLFDREDRALVLARRTQTASVLFDRLERDLLTAVTATPDGPGIVGDDHSITIAHRAVFVGGQGSPHTDLQRTLIHFERERGVLTLVREDAFKADEQVTEDRPSDVTANHGPDEPEGVLATDIREVRFRYHDGVSWRSSFTSNRRFPVAVEIALWFDRGVPGDEPGDPDDPEAFAGNEFDPADEFGAPFDIDSAMFEQDEADSTPASEPDRLRVIVIPDARDEPTVGGGGAAP
ncbi:MAG: prepilin-type N-terminal cleavage/methylation domain-containing protein [Phycisphaerales bacterium]|nr:prepilin-type N-terminal cleavage/methylation domain-containing protein [Phycisphaerales bacterium]